ncbi:MAG TPA: hypothetical protein VMV47_04300 [Bacteroidales bacterium]|nr:hypothetical protein [Bacteroidales bacterium]
MNEKEKAVFYYQKFLDNIKDATMNFTPEYEETIKQRLEYIKGILLEKKAEQDKRN